MTGAERAELEARLAQLEREYAQVQTTISESRRRIRALETLIQEIRLMLSGQLTLPLDTVSR